MNRTINLTFGLALTLLVAGSASAQTIDGSAYFSPLTDNVQPLIYGNVFSKSYREKHRVEKHSPRSRGEYYSRDKTAPASDVFGATLTDFEVSFDPRISDDVRKDYIDSLARANGAKAANSLGDYYSRTSVHQLFGKAVSPYGLRGDDFADVTTAYVVVMWMIANQTALPSTGDVQGVRGQMREILSAERRIPVRAGERQRAAESLIYQTVTLIKVREEAQSQGNQAFLSHLADSAQASMARQKFDLRGLVMSDEGLVQR